MFNKIANFLSLISDDSHVPPEELSCEIASAVLLCEVMKADDHFSAEEEATIAQLLHSQFQLSSEEVSEIIREALQLSESATDFYQFTSQLNRKFTVEQKIHMVELLWQLAYCDGELSSIEEHIIRKVSDLLHLRHHEYIASKTKAIAQAKS